MKRPLPWIRRVWKILLRHILPNATAPLIVQGTYVCAEAILVEAILSFLGVGMPVEAATWGNIMAEGRSQFNAYPHMVLLPGIFLVLTESFQSIFSVTVCAIHWTRSSRSGATNDGIFSQGSKAPSA